MLECNIIRIIKSETNTFTFTICLDQRSTLSTYLFALVINDLTRHISKEVIWCMLFVNDIVSIEEARMVITTN